MSVSRPVYSADATSVSRASPSRSSSSATTTAVAAAFGSTRCSVPYRVLLVWWSMTTTASAVVTGPASDPRRSALPLSSVTSTRGARGTRSAGTSRSSAGRKE